MSIETVPEGFMARLLNEFGLQWTHLVVLSGVVFSSFDLEKYLNPGIWILSTVAAFAVVYLFRRQIPPDFPKVALWSIVAMLAGVGIPIAIMQASGVGLGEFMSAWTQVGTLYLAFVIGVPLGASIISYRQQDEFARLRPPEVVEPQGA